MMTPSTPTVMSPAMMSPTPTGVSPIMMPSSPRITPTTKTTKSYTEARFQPGDLLIFGKETKGLPEDILKLYSDRCYTIPMSNSNIRSLNLAMTAGIVLYEALRQICR